MRQGTSSGTGFFFTFKLGPSKTLPVLITNKHVIEGVIEADLFVHTGTQKDGKLIPASESFHITLDNFESRWIKHPGRADLCAMPFQPIVDLAQLQGKTIFKIDLSEDLIPSDVALEQLVALEDVIMVGYPIGLSDTINNYPLLRKGTTASHPAVNFNGDSIGAIDIAAFPGSSGSPVFIFNEGSYPIPSGIALGSRAIFLGILSSGPVYTADGQIAVVGVPNAPLPLVHTSIPIHLGYYVKSSELASLRDEVLRAYKLL